MADLTLLVQTCLDSIAKVKCSLKLEAALLYGQLGNHQKVFELLVKELRDFHHAEWPCVNYPAIKYPEDGKARDTLIQDLLCHLMSIYLSLTPVSHKNVCISNMLNIHYRHLDMSRVFTMLPDEWPLNSISQYLTSYLETNIFQHRQSSIKKGLLYSRNLALKVNSARDEKNLCLYMPTGIRAKRCQVCNSNINHEEVFSVKYEKSHSVNTRVQAIIHNRCLEAFNAIERETDQTKHMRGSLLR